MEPNFQEDELSLETKHTPIIKTLKARVIIAAGFNKTYCTRNVEMYGTDKKIRWTFC